LVSYIGLIRKEKKSDFGVDFPDFPGCITAGKTLEEAREMAQEALEGHIKVGIEFGDPIPEPSSLDKIMSDPENQDAVAFLVPVAVARPRARRINVTIPETVLEEIDEYVRTHPGENRSQLLARGAKRLIGNSAREKETPARITHKRQ
jgi:predicted RNase H-like HicB family nuclease